jgi:hypothetical protein
MRVLLNQQPHFFSFSGHIRNDRTVNDNAGLQNPEFNLVVTEIYLTK